MDTRYCNGQIHIVKQGDSLYQISRMYHVPLALILRANPYVDVYNLQIGQEICVPIIEMPGSGMEPGEMRPGGMRPDEMEMDRIPNDRILYVTDGEITLGDLLKEYDISWEDFMKMNDLSQILLAKDVVLYLPKKV